MTTKPFLGPAPYAQSVVLSFEGTTGALAKGSVSQEDLIEDIKFMETRFSIPRLTEEMKIWGQTSFDDLPLSEKMKHWGPMYGPLGPGRKTRR